MVRTKRKVAPAKTKTTSKDVPKGNVSESSNSDNEKENNTQSVMKPPHKRVGAKIHTPLNRKKKRNGREGGITLKVEGYAFQDDIIGVTHIRSDGEDAFNMRLRNMIYSDSLEGVGFTSCVTLRDKNSGKEDEPLVGVDGYPRNMFMCINIHTFKDVEEASEPVLEQCQHLHDVSTHLFNTSQQTRSCYSYLLLFSFAKQEASDAVHNIFNYKYEPVTEASNRTGDKLLVVSDLIRYADAYRILRACYGDEQNKNKLEEGFGKKYPGIISKYFSNVNEIPDRIKQELGL